MSTVQSVAAVAVAATVGMLSACQTVPEPSSAPGRGMTGKVEGPVSAQDISDAYLYLLGRMLVLRQQRRDFEQEGFAWNQLVHHERGGVKWANPNLDVVYSEAWVAVDESTCVQLDIPKITGRYYTWQMLNGWGETVLNINERTFPDTPFGRYALCLKGSKVAVPAGARRIDLPVRTARVLARVELGADPAAAVRLQHAFTLRALGEPRIASFPRVPLFENTALPGAEAFEMSAAILDGEPDINPGMGLVRSTVRAVAAMVGSGPAGRQQVQKAIDEVALPTLRKWAATRGHLRNGWLDVPVAGNYGSDFKARTALNLSGIWANNRDEMVAFGTRGLDGGATYVQTFSASALPGSMAGYFWSVVAVDAKEFRILPNAPGRHILNKEAGLQYGADGSLMLAYGPVRPSSVPESNWLPTVPGQRYNLTFRMYGPAPEVLSGGYYPAELRKLEN